MNDCPDCYGKYPTPSDPCENCEYEESCRYYTATTPPRGKKQGPVGFVDNCAADTAEPTPSETGDRFVTEAELANVLRYLMELDEYTLSLLAEVITAPAGSLSVSALAQRRGVTRQAIHHKLISILENHRELAPVFRGLFRKLSRARSRALRRTP